MSKSLAELRASTSLGLPERSREVCLAAGLVAKVQTLVRQIEELRLEERPASSSQRMGSGGNSARVAELSAELESVRAEMLEHTGVVTLRAVEPEAWWAWVDEHPPREDNARDKSAAYGMCDADALLKDLARYVVAWNDEPTAGDMAAWVVGKLSAGDRVELARTVVEMHEGAPDLGKLRLASRVTRPAESD